MARGFRQPTTAAKYLRLRREIALAIFLLHVAGGLTSYATYMIDRGLNWAWY
jgi:hypothetical protein